MKFLFKYWGKVITGKKRGRDLGFPTANIKLHQKISEGVYTSEVTIDGIDYPSATFIGKSKTFDEKDYKSESYILDFNNNVYVKWITIKLFKKLRGNIKFNSEKELIGQIKLDVTNTRKFFSTSNFIDSNQK